MTTTTTNMPTSPVSTGSAQQSGVSHLSQTQFEISEFPLLFYFTVVAPRQTFQAISDFSKDQPKGNPGNHWIMHSVLAIALVSGLAPALTFALEGGDLSALMFNVPSQMIFGLGMWLFMAMVISLVAFVFSGKSQVRLLLVLTALATMPWLLSGPIVLLQETVPYIGVVLHGLLWLWSSILFAMAVAETYKLSLEQTAIVLVLPFLMGTVSLFWVFGFFINMARMMP